MNWSFIANLKLIWCVMNPLCRLARVWKLMAAVMCVHACACAVCVCVHTGGPACGRLRARQPFWCVLCTWYSAHRWVGYAGWAQRRLAEIQAISPTSIITHNYTLNELKNRVTTNQPGSHREKWSFINGPIYIIKVYFIFVLFDSNLAIPISFCPPVMLSRGASMTSSASVLRDVFTPDVTQINRSRPHLPLGIPKTWFCSSTSLIPVADGKTNLVLICGKTILPNTGEVCPPLTLLQQLREQRPVPHAVKVSFSGLTTHKPFP